MVILHLVISQKSGCSFVNVLISEFHNHLQIKFYVNISICQTQFKNKQKQFDFFDPVIESRFHPNTALEYAYKM